MLLARISGPWSAPNLHTVLKLAQRKRKKLPEFMLLFSIGTIMIKMLLSENVIFFNSLWLMVDDEKAVF
jgi:hypothetical protein